MKTRPPRALAAAAALALALGACTDVPTSAPAARAPGARATLASSGPTLISNTIKYRDTGGKPARGRSGSAELEALAVLDREGVTTLNLSAHHVTETWRYGSITNAHLKASAADGQHKFTRNLVGSGASFTGRGPIPPEVQLKGLGRGDQLQVQANVAGIDPHRIDVVTVTEEVKLLPDLRVELSAPAEVESGTPVNILAVVSEGNGDMGTGVWCQLFVAGYFADFVPGAWVDAGDAVTCAFTWNFPTPGTYPLEVRVFGTSREWDTSNNTDTATIQVNGESPRFYTSAWFSQSTAVDTTVTFQSWADVTAGTTREYRSERAETSTRQSATLYGHMPIQVDGPADLRISMSTGGRVVTSDEWTQPADPWGFCTSRWDGRAMFWICSRGGPLFGSTDFNYSFFAGSVTYHSRGYSRTWDTNTGTDLDVYHWNDVGGNDDGVEALGGDWSFDVRLVTPNGEHTAQRTLLLGPGESFESSFPYSCWEWGYPDWGYGTDCFAFSQRVNYIIGF